MVALRVGESDNPSVLRWGEKLLKESCDTGLARSCAALADWYVYIDAGPEAEKIAMEQYRRGCVLGDQHSCERTQKKPEAK
jgi:TPR repeat protein